MCAFLSKRTKPFTVPSAQREGSSDLPDQTLPALQAPQCTAAAQNFSKGAAQGGFTDRKSTRLNSSHPH